MNTVIDPNDIAIIGMSCRFPQAENLDEFWTNLVMGRCCTTEHSDAELQASGVDPAEYKRPEYVRTSGSVEGIESFDAAFFDYNPREASLIDPQHRMFMEQSWRALEDANIPPARFRGRIGVYAGTGMNTYLFNNLQTHEDLVRQSGGYPLMVASDKDFLATRVSYKLNLKGPSLTIQTACSSSLVAIHTACQSLRAGECDAALAGGVSLRVPQKAGYLYQEGLILAPDGICRAFDAKAKGTVIGNGAGVVVLKLLEEAVRDGDQIYAVIKASALNNDGAVKVGYTAPGMESQAAAIYEALSLANLEASAISYVETHGTGTTLGDPIEIAALHRAFDGARLPAASCAIGSVKTNIGHLDAAAGVAGLIKTALALKHRQIPASLHYEEPNPKIDFRAGPFYVNTALRDWPSDGAPRRAGVSSFGIGGTNAHAVLEEAPAPIAGTAGAARAWHCICLSAKSADALERRRTDLARRLAAPDAPALADLAGTLAACRSALPQRSAFCCQTISEARDFLEKPDSQRWFGRAGIAAKRELGFLFPGQGAQYPGMARELYATEPAFREGLERCFGLAARHCAADLRGLVFPDDTGDPAAAVRLQDASVAQLSLFAVEYSLGELLLSWGLRPSALLGHSVGEYAAACLAGVFDLETAIRLLAERGRLVLALPAGTMLSVPLPAAELSPLLGTELSLAVENGPALSVAAGPAPAIAALQAQLAAKGLRCTPLNTSHAFHSAMLDPMLAEWRALLRTADLAPPRIPIISSCTGDWLSDAEATDPEYWVRHLRQTVRFSSAAARLLDHPGRALVELGPGKVLGSLLSLQTGTFGRHLVVNSLPPAQSASSAAQCFEEALAALWVEGAFDDWSARTEARAGGYGKVRLPGYAFDRQRCWIDPVKRSPAPDTSPFSAFTIAESPLARPSADSQSGGECLVFGLDEPWCRELMGQLQAQGWQPTVLLPKGGLDPDRVLERLPRTPSAQRLVYLWSMDEASDRRSHAAVLLKLAAHFAGGASPTRLSAWLPGSLDVSGCEVSDPAFSQLAALAQLLADPDGFTLQLVDPGPRPSTGMAGELLAFLRPELPDCLVARRGRKRWASRLVSMDKALQKQAGPLLLPTEPWLALDGTGLEARAREGKAPAAGVIFRAGSGEALVDECLPALESLAAASGWRFVAVLVESPDPWLRSLWAGALARMDHDGGRRWFCVETAGAPAPELETLRSLLTAAGPGRWRGPAQAANQGQGEATDSSPSAAALPATGRSFGPRPALASAYLAPSNETEAKIVAIWEEALGIRPVGIQDNFFELGGTSLMIAHIVGRLRGEFQSDLPVMEAMYQKPTPQYLAEFYAALAPVDHGSGSESEETYITGEL